ncbi:MAG TPA: hypothetical protein VFK27_03600, partial [Bacillales bacterium]|nr:hypothetical protein [Bacillales bacterium]
MRLKKTALRAFIAVFALGLVLSGCSSKQSGGNSPSGGQTITVWHSMTDTTKDALTQVTDAFEKKH